MNKKFGVNDYFLMYKKYGIRLPIDYFIQNHLFDLFLKVDTHKRVLKKDYSVKPKNFEHGIMYMSSFWSVVYKSINFIYKNEINFKSFNLVDVGSGKGKVLIIWKYYCKIKKLSNKIIGIEYSKDLIDISKKNLKDSKDVRLINSGVLGVPEDLFTQGNIIYLFNPFDEVVMKNFVDKLNTTTYIIYNNPVHLEILLEKGFKILHSVHGYHPNRNWMILKYI